MITPRTVRTSLLTVVLLSLAMVVLAQEQVRTVEFSSPAVDRTMKYNIVLPPEYESSNERYPVLYLLHGLTQNYTAWGGQGVPVYTTGVGTRLTDQRDFRDVVIAKADPPRTASVDNLCEVAVYVEAYRYPGAKVQLILSVAAQPGEGGEWVVEGRRIARFDVGRNGDVIGDHQEVESGRLGEFCPAE